MLTHMRAAQYAALIMYAWDMCSHDLHCLSPVPDPRIAAMGWRLFGYITGGDNIISSSAGVRNKVLGVSLEDEDRVCYGYLASNTDGEIVVVIRGTDGALEWLDDFDFFPRPPSLPLRGLVDGGFYSIYLSMRYHAAGDEENSLSLAVAVANIMSLTVTVIGHSLGAALATYLAAELSVKKGASGLAAYFFASPKPGNSTFAAYFDSHVAHYQVFNYVKDIIPLVPPIGYVSLSACTLLMSTPPHMTILSDKRCCHHLISYIALLSPEFYKQLITIPGMTFDDNICASCVIVTQ